MKPDPDPDKHELEFLTQLNDRGEVVPDSRFALRRDILHAP